MSSSEDYISFSGEPQRIVETLSVGRTAEVYRLERGCVLKRFTHELAWKLCEHEAFWLVELEDNDIAPKLIDVDDSSPTLLLSEAGDRISADSAPADVREQLAGHLELLRDRGCFHNDLLARNLTVLDGRLRIVDFAMATDRPPHEADEWITVPKVRYALDEYAIEQVALSLYGLPAGHELHFAVMRAGDGLEGVTKWLESRFTVTGCYFCTGAFTYHAGMSLQGLISELSGLPGVAEAWPEAFYPFFVFCFTDSDPRYERVSHPLTGERVSLNVATAALYDAFGAGSSSYLWISTTRQERDHARALLHVSQRGEPLRIGSMRKTSA